MKRTIPIVLLIAVIFYGLYTINKKNSQAALSESTESVEFLNKDQEELRELLELYRQNREMFEKLSLMLAEFSEEYTPIEIDIDRRYLYEEMAADLDRLKEAYPGLIQTEILGQSEDGRDIHLLKLGKGEHKSLLLGGVHGCEIAATPLLVKMANEYAIHYYSEEEFDGFNVKELLDKVTLYIVPLVNPDGMEIAVNGGKTLLTQEVVEVFKQIPGRPFTDWKANARGVDLNRNFTCTTWGQVLTGKVAGKYIKTEPYAEFYGGPQPASEKETRALENLMKENDFQILFDIHSRGRVIYYYKGMQSEKFNATTYKIAQEVNRYSGYEVLPPSMSTYGQGTDGNTTDFAAEAGIHSLTIETMPFHISSPYPVELIKEEWEYCKALGLVLARETINLLE